MYRMQEEVSRLRALAASCREVARVIRYRPDQEVAQAQARHYEDAADRLEQAMPPPHAEREGLRVG
jgi:hypothetical protein